MPYQLAVEKGADVASPRSKRYDGVFEVPTFEEVLDLVERQSRHRGEVIGVCPDLKQPSYRVRSGMPPTLFASVRPGLP